MFRLTSRGYTGVYDQGWLDTAGTLGLYIGLRIVDGAVGGALGGAVGAWGSLVVVHPS